MKKHLLVLICTSVTSVLFSQESSKPDFKVPRAIIKLAPLQFVHSTLELGIEAFNSTYSRSFNISAGYRTASFEDFYEDGFGTNLELGYRKYARPMEYRVRNGREYYQGVYYSLFARAEYFKADVHEYFSGVDTTLTEKVVAFVPGFVLGYQKTLWKVLMLDLYVGGGIRFAKVQYSTKPPDFVPYYVIGDPGYHGIIPKFGVKIGIGL